MGGGKNNAAIGKPAEGKGLQGKAGYNNGEKKKNNYPDDETECA